MEQQATDSPMAGTPANDTGQVQEAARCVSCGSALHEGERYCSLCGAQAPKSQPAPTEQNRACPRCGKEYTSGAVYCALDGTRLVPVETAPPRCVRCGVVYLDGSRFCPKDGGAIISGEPYRESDKAKALDIARFQGRNPAAMLRGDGMCAERNTPAQSHQPTDADAENRDTTEQLHSSESNVSVKAEETRLKRVRFNAALASAGIDPQSLGKSVGEAGLKRADLDIKQPFLTAYAVYRDNALPLAAATFLALLSVIPAFGLIWLTFIDPLYRGSVYRFTVCKLRKQPTTLSNISPPQIGSVIWANFLTFLPFFLGVLALLLSCFLLSGVRQGLTHFLLVISAICGAVLTIVGLYTSLSFFLGVPLAALGNLRGMEAVGTSRRVIRMDWAQMLSIMACYYLLRISGIVFLGVGLLVTIPMSDIFLATIYAEVFGIDPLNGVDDEAAAIRKENAEAAGKFLGRIWQAALLLFLSLALLVGFVFVFNSVREAFRHPY